MATKMSGNQEVDIFKDEKDGKLREVGNQAVWSLSSCKPGFGVDQLRDESHDTYWQSDGPQPHLVNIQFHRKTTIHDVCIYADYKSDESYTPNRYTMPQGLAHILFHVGGSRKEVYRALWGSLKFVAKLNTGGKHTLVYPEEVREAVPKRFGNPPDAGAYDAQYIDQGYHVTMKDLAKATWRPVSLKCKRISIRAGNHANDLTEVEQLELSEPSGWVCVPLRDSSDRPIRTFMLQLAVLSNHQNGRDTHIRRIKVRSPHQSSDVGAGRLPMFTSKELQQHAFVR